MNKAFFLQLVFNASLLLTLALIYDLVAVQLADRSGLAAPGAVGVIIGIMGVIVMLASWKLEPGIVFDTRSILLGVSGLFFGTVPTVVAMAITAVYRGLYRRSRRLDGDRGDLHFGSDRHRLAAYAPVFSGGYHLA